MGKQVWKAKYGVSHFPAVMAAAISDHRVDGDDLHQSGYGLHLLDLNDLSYHMIKRER